MANDKPIMLKDFPVLIPPENMNIINMIKQSIDRKK